MTPDPLTDSPDHSNIPLVPEASVSGPVVFPSVETDPVHKGDSTTSSKLTSSDKLSALRSPPSPPLRALSPSRIAQASISLPSFESLSPSQIPNVTPGSILPTAVSEGSFRTKGKESPKQRVSFDSDRGAIPTIQSVRQAFSRGTRASDPPASSSVIRESNERHSHTPRRSLESPGSRPTSRANSPLRIFQWGLHRAHSREEPFVPVDPFKLRLRFKEFRRQSLDSHDHLQALDCDYDCNEACCLPLPCSCLPRSSTYIATTQTFLVDTLPRQLYLHFLLRLPSLYWSRVARVFEDAEVSRPDIQRMIDACSVPRSAADGTTSGGARGGGALHAGGTATVLPFPEEWSPPAVSPALVRFKLSWEEFIDSLLREWKTLNVVSALLLSAIVSMFQVQSAIGDPVTRTAALLSLVCALMSLSYGCVYLIRFGSMRSMYKASQWAQEARKMNTLVWWNVWVLLAMPGVWLAWSMILFIIAILSFVWRTGSTDDPLNPAALSPTAALGPRIAITGVFGLGLVYFALIVKTLRRYGRSMSAGEREAARALGMGHGPASERGDGEDRRGRERVRRSAGGNERQQDSGRREKTAEVTRLKEVLGHGVTVESASAENTSSFPATDPEKGDVLTTVPVVERTRRSSEF